MDGLSVRSIIQKCVVYQSVRSIIVDLLCITLFHSAFYFLFFYFLSFLLSSFLFFFRFESYYNRFVPKYSYDLTFLYIKSQFLVKSYDIQNENHIFLRIEKNYL